MENANNTNIFNFITFTTRSDYSIWHNVLDANLPAYKEFRDLFSTMEPNSQVFTTERRSIDDCTTGLPIRCDYVQCWQIYPIIANLPEQTTGNWKQINTHTYTYTRKQTLYCVYRVPKQTLIIFHIHAPDDIDQSPFKLQIHGRQLRRNALETYLWRVYSRWVWVFRFQSHLPSFSYRFSYVIFPPLLSISLVISEQVWMSPQGK